MAASTPAKYNESVFINCPFDPQYKALFDALVFAVTDCGFIARCALEDGNSGVVRVQKILRLIRECRIGIHDISRVEASPSSKLPRFNMPLELGMFLGAMEYGVGKQRRKTCLVLDKLPYRYQKFISDLAAKISRRMEEKLQGSSKPSETTSPTYSLALSFLGRRTSLNGTEPFAPNCPRFAWERTSRWPSSRSKIAALL